MRGGFPLSYGGPGVPGKKRGNCGAGEAFLRLF